jgi:curved DNA-binding protein CbpA
LERLERADTHYAVLGADVRAGSAEINAAYRETVIALTRAFNDLRDIVPGDQLQGFKSAFARVREAHNVLGNPAWRAEYDNHLKKNSPAASGASTGFEIVGENFVAVGIDADPVAYAGSNARANQPPRQRQERPAPIFDASKWSGPDRRRWPRVSREEIVALRYLNESADTIGVSLGTTENVGRRGARIRVEKPAPEFHMVRVMCGEVGFESLAALCRSYHGRDSRQRLCINFIENEWGL